MRTFNAIVAVADISGYTRFVVMHRSSVAHAEQIVSELMETVTEHAEFPLKVQKLEGDAAFMAAEVSGPMDVAVNDVMRQVVSFMAEFKKKQTDLFDKSVGGCPCTACQTIETLGLKTIVHAGTVLEKEMSGFTELAGEPVIVAHRLLKNSIEGSNYILATEEVASLLKSKPYEDSRKIRETIEDVGTVSVTAYHPPGQLLDRQGVSPVSSISACLEALRLFAARLISKVKGSSRPFKNLPV